MEKLKSHISKGAIIKWVRYHSPQKIWVHLMMNGLIIREIIPLKNDYTDKSFRKIRSSAASRPGSIQRTIWSSDTRLDLLRLASFLGINAGGTCNTGPGQEFWVRWMYNVIRY
jgi:hypothetical protein